MQKKIKIFILTLFVLTPLITQAGFDPNYIISDKELLDYDSMNLESIENFLRDKNSFLSTYKCPNAYGAEKSTAEIIYDAVQNNYDCDDVELSEDADEAERKTKCTPLKTINPKALLVLLQKEQGLITNENPEERRLNWATGYGCPDSGGCNPRWKGFGKQINSAALQFLDYMENPENYPYQAGGKYTLTNPFAASDIPTTTDVTPKNQATASLYNYTPHVYNGNYNFYKFWHDYFTKIYPNGSLLQADGEIGVWLIEHGEKRPFLTRGALTTRFDENKIIIVGKSDLDAYPKGDPIKFANYSIIKSPLGTLYLLVDDKKRKFINEEAFRKIGFNPEEIIEASYKDLEYYTDGANITSTSTYPTGALLQNKVTGGVYFVKEGEKAAVLDRVFLTTKFKNKSIIPTSEEELENYKTIDAVRFEDGELLTPDNSSAVFLISDQKRRVFRSSNSFEKLGYKWENVITVPEKIINLYPLGEPLSLVN